MSATPSRIKARAESRDAALQQLGFRSYQDYLRSPEWKAKRIRHRDTYGDGCSLCETEDTKTQLHHMTYERVGQELLTDLTWLCENCHQIIHTLERRGEIGLDFSGLVDLQRALKYVREDQPRADRMDALPNVAEHSEAKRKIVELAKDRRSLLRAKQRRNKPSPGIDHRIRKIDARMSELS